MKNMIVVVLLVAVTQFAFADNTETYGWEGTRTVLGNYGDIICSIDTDPVHGGSQSLKLVDDAASGTPQAYVAWIVGLSDGNQVTVSFWRYDTTPAAAPSCRIWGGWNNDPGDINSYGGSAGGLTDYGPGTGWDKVEYTWTIEGGHPGLVIQVRTYSSAGDTVWIDDMTITAPGSAEIRTPAYTMALTPHTWASIKATF
jgi:hypothetical protein